MAVAQFGTDCGPASSSTFWFGPLVKVGGSFTPVTVIVNVWVGLVSWPPLAVPASSTAFTLTVAMPFWLAAGVNVSVPAALTAGATENRPLLLLVTTKEIVWPPSLAGPLLIADAQAATDSGPLFSRTTWSGPFVKLGASLTAVSVIVNVCGGLSSLPPASSWAFRVTVDTPFALAAGVYVSVPFEATAGPDEKRSGLPSVDDERDSLPVLVRGSRTDVRRPAADRLGPGVFEVGLIGALRE